MPILRSLRAEPALCPRAGHDVRDLALRQRRHQGAREEEEVRAGGVYFEWRIRIRTGPHEQSDRETALLHILRTAVFASTTLSTPGLAVQGGGTKNRYRFI